MSDHVARSLEEIENADVHLGIDEFAYADLSLKRALVHATIALVEAQQTANMIAYVAKWTDGEVLEVDEQIRVRLGFEGRP